MTVEIVDAEDVADPTPAPPQREGDLPGLRVRASQANAAGVATEILVQRLVHARREPRAKHYRDAAYLTFTADSTVREIALPVGAWAVAYRFTNLATSQQTASTPIGTTTVR